MLEIVLIVFLCKKMGSILHDKGWKKTFWMQFFVVIVYLGSLVAGSAVYAIYVAITQGEAAIDKLGFSLYLAAYVGAIFGVGSLFLSTKLIKNRSSATGETNGFTARQTPETFTTPPPQFRQ